MGALIDTSVLVRLERMRAGFEVPPDEEVAISAITVAELLHGVHRARTAPQRARREALVTKLLQVLPALPFDETAARVHARVWSELASAGVTIGPHDLIIAATAMARGWAVVTMNARDFSRVPGLEVRGAGT
jgi:tRNA(fMet)-specific endonuclease VapC